jgi:hypothetical protein
MAASGIFMQDFHRNWHIQPHGVNCFVTLLHEVDDTGAPHAASLGIANQSIAQSSVCVCARLCAASFFTSSGLGGVRAGKLPIVETCKHENVMLSGSGPVHCTSRWLFSASARVK